MNNGLYLAINEGLLLDNVSNIKSIVERFYQDMENLNNIINTKIDEGIQTNWATDLKDSWNQYYTSDIPGTAEEMTNSAINLEKAVAEWKLINR